MEWLAEFFSKLHHFDDLIRWGGYMVLTGIVFAETGLLIGFFLPGDSMLVTAGLIAASGEALHIGWLIGLLCIAAVAGDSVGYAIGYHLGPRIFSKEDSRWFHKDHVARTQAFYEKYGAKTIVLARFVPIVRTFAPTVAGVGKMRYAAFLTYNLIGGVAWVCSMTLVGFYLGKSIPDVEKHLHWILLAIIFLSILPILHEWRRSRKAPAPKGPAI